MSQPRSDYAIEVDGLSVDYRFRQSGPRRSGLAGVVPQRRRHAKIVALDDVFFKVERGAASAIIGRNGAGKSTLMRVLADAATRRGQVRVNGRMSTLLSLGVGFNANLPGRDNIYIGGLAVGMQRSEIDDRFDDIVAFSELGNAIDRPVKTYSSGMFARLAFSISINLDPDILLIDEALSVGDAAFNRKSRQAMHDLLDKSGTLVFVSHAMEAVRKVCNEAIWIHEGKVHDTGEVMAIAKRYEQEYRIAKVAGKGVTQTKADVAKWTTSERVKVVVQLLKGADIEDLSVEHGVTAEEIMHWRNVFVDGGRNALRTVGPVPAAASTST